VSNFLFTNDTKANGRVVTLIALCLIGTCLPAFSQPQAIDPAPVESYFDSLIGIENSGIINGRQYKMALPGARSSPFFGPGEVHGVVRYHQQTFDAPLLYDIFKDEIVVKHISSQGVAWFIQLDKKFVEGFNLSGRLFRNFSRGFHEAIFEGDDFLILAKRSRAQRQERGAMNYIDIDRYFFVEHDHWNSLFNKNSFLKVLDSKEDKKAFRLFVRENRIKIRKFRQDDLMKVGEYLSKLRNSKRE
jgi:hypothetical protein